MKRCLSNPIVLTHFIFWSVVLSYARQVSLNITVDPRIELLSVVQLLSDYDNMYNLLTDYDLSYKQDVVKYFSAYKNHPAVTIFSEISAYEFNYDTPPAVMLYLSKPPNLDLVLPFSDYLKTRAGGEINLIQFIEALRSFANETEFMNFFNTHIGTYQSITNEVKEKLKGFDNIGILEDYFGMYQNSYNIVLAPLFQIGGYGPRIERSDSTYDIYNICGPVDVNNGLPDFGPTEHLVSLMWHEFSHSYVNPTTAIFSSQIATYSSLLDPIASEMEKQAYSTWESCVNEHIVRAITARLIYREVSKELEDRILQYEKHNGFIYIENLYGILHTYENQRDKYPTFVDFYPQFIEVFKRLPEGLNP